MKSNHLRGHKNALIKCSSSCESLQQLDYLLNYFGCQQTAICNEGMFSHIMTTDSWCQTGYAFQFVPGNNNNYSSCKSSLHYSMNSFRSALFPKTGRPSCETGGWKGNAKLWWVVVDLPLCSRKAKQGLEQISAV